MRVSELCKAFGLFFTRSHRYVKKIGFSCQKNVKCVCDSLTNQVDHVILSLAIHLSDFCKDFSALCQIICQGNVKEMSGDRYKGRTTR